MRWDREKFPQPNLHMYGKNGTKIVVYNVRRRPKKRDWKNLEKKIKKYNTKRRVLDSWLYYSGYAEDDFYILYFLLLFQTTYDRYLHSKIRLTFSLMLCKFIVWACWAKTQSCFGVQVKIGPYNWHRLWEELDLIWRKLWSSVGDGRIRFALTYDWPTPR